MSSGNVLNHFFLGIHNCKGGIMGRRKKEQLSEVSGEFVADIAPTYEGRQKKEYDRQGRSSFLDDFYTLYRRWVKNE